MDLSVKISAVVDGLVSSIKQAATEVQNFGKVAEAPKKIVVDTQAAQSAIKDLTEKAKSAGGELGGIGKSILGVFGGGVLLGGISGILGGFDKVISKGKAAIEMQENMKLAFRASGLSVEESEKALSKNAKATGELSDKYAVSKKDINEATGAFLRFGGSSDNLKQKQENIIGLAAKLGGNYELAARALAKATDPEIEGQLTKFGIKFEKNATEAERQRVITEKLGGTLQGLAEKADTPLGKMQRVQNTIGGIASTIGVALVESVAPIVGLIGDVVLPLIQGTISAIKAVIGTIKTFFTENAAAIRVVLVVIAAGALAAGLAMYGGLIPALLTSAAGFVAMGISAAAAWVAVNAPIILIVAGITAVAAGIIYLYNHFEAVRNAITLVWNIAKAVFDGLIQYVVDYAKILYSIGELIFTVLITPLKIAYGVIAPIVGAIFDLVKSLFSFNTAATESKGAIDYIKEGFAILHTVMQTIMVTIKSVTAGISAFAETASGVITKLLKLDFAGAVETAKEGGKKMADATTGAFSQGMENIQTEKAAKKFEEDFTKAKDGIAKTLADGIEVKTNIDTTKNLDKLEKSLENTQEKLKPLQLKVEAGEKLTDKEKKSFDELSQKAAEVSGKIKDVAPEAVAGIKTVVSSNGTLIQSYEINKQKLSEVAEKSKAAFGEEQAKNAGKFGKSITDLSALYEGQKAKLNDLKKAIDEANAKGDTKGAAKLTEEFKTLSTAANATGKELKDSFEKGAKAGLLTDEAAGKVGVSLGQSAEQAIKLAHGLQDVAANAAKATLDTKALGEAFDAAKKKTEDTQKDEAQGAAGVEFALRNLKKETADIEINLKKKIKEAEKAGNKEQADALKKSYAEDVELAKQAALDKYNAATKTATPIKSIEEAAKLSKEANKKLLDDQNKQNKEAGEIEKIRRKTDVLEINKEDQKAAKNKLTDELSNIEKSRLANEKAARDKVQSELDLAVQLLQIQGDADQLKFEAQKKAAEKDLALKAKDKGFTDADRQAAKLGIEKIEDDKQKAAQDTLVKIQTEKGKFAVKEYEDNKKRLEEQFKLESEFAKKTVELTEARKSDSSFDEARRLVDLNSAKLEVIRAGSAQEISEALNKNEKVVKADEALKAALAKGNDKLIEQARQAATAARNDALANDVNIQQIQKNADAALAKQQKENIQNIELFRISLIEDNAERERQTRLIEVDKTLEAELLAARGNERLITDAKRKATDERVKIEEDAARKSENAGVRFGQAALDLTKGFSANFTAQLAPIFDTFGAIEKRFMKFADTVAKANEDVANNTNEEYTKATDAAFQQLKKREIDYKRYTEIVNEAAKKNGGNQVGITSQVNAAIGKSFLEVGKQAQAHLKETFGEMGKQFKDVNGKFKSTGEIVSTFFKDASKTINDTALTIGSTLGVLAASGELTMESAKKAVLGTAFDTVSSLIMTYIPAIFGSAVSFLGPIAGPIAAGLLTGIVQGLLATAKGALGFWTGGYTGDGDRMEVAGYVHKGEGVIEQPVMRGQKTDFLEMRKILQSGVPIRALLDSYKAPTLSNSAVSNQGQIIQVKTAQISNPASDNGAYVRALENQTAALLQSNQQLKQELKSELVRNRTTQRKIEQTVDLAPANLTLKGNDLHAVIQKQQNHKMSYGL